MNKKETTRDQIIVIRVTALEKKQIQKNAERYGISISDLARQFLLKGHAWAKSTNEISEFVLNRKTLIGLANNLNQLTRYAHQKKSFLLLWSCCKK